jgi:hypothetical protein
MNMNQQVEPISKPELLKRIRSERQYLAETLAQLSEDQMVKPGAEAAWSVKDMLAHLVAWEEYLVQWVDQILRGQAPELPAGVGGIDQVNAEIYEENKDRPLTEVLTEFQTSYQEVLRCTEAASEEILLQTGLFPAWGDTPLWDVVASNTYWHYQEHGEALRAWLAREEAG